MIMRFLTRGAGLLAAVCLLVACRHQELHYSEIINVAASLPEEVEDYPVTVAFFPELAPERPAVITLDGATSCRQVLLPPGRFHVCAHTSAGGAFNAVAGNGKYTVAHQPLIPHTRMLYTATRSGSTADFNRGDTLNLRLEAAAKRITVKFHNVINDNEVDSIMGSLTGITSSWTYADGLASRDNIMDSRPAFEERSDGDSHTLIVELVSLGHTTRADCSHLLNMNYMLPDGSVILVNPQFNPECDLTAYFHTLDFTPGSQSDIDIYDTLTVPLADTLRRDQLFFVEVDPFEEPPIYIDVY